MILGVSDWLSPKLNVEAKNIRIALYLLFY